MTNTTSITDTDRLEFLIKYEVVVTRFGEEFLVEDIHDNPNWDDILGKGATPRDAVNAAIIKRQEIDAKEKQEKIMRTRAQINQLQETLAKLEAETQQQAL